MRKAIWSRIGLGLAALGTGIVALWPKDFANIDPEKGYAFLAALAAWLFVEFYTGTESSAATARKVSSHDEWAASKIRSLFTDHDVRFLEQHDFGASWWASDIKNVMDLTYELGQSSIQFSDEELQKTKEDLKKEVDQFLRTLSANCQTIGARQLFTLLTDEERVNDHWGKDKQQIVEEINALADRSAASIREFLRIANTKNLVLAPPEQIGGAA